jgi:peptidoglycan/LPS O-acetylase OafA/YrhL
MTKLTIKDSGFSDLSGLHLLRFLLALSILIAHFPHFFFPYADAQLDRRVLPFQPYLDLIYSYGGFAVEIFWMISGVIFYVFYMREISDRRISFPVFLGYRLSKLNHFIF